MASYGSFYCRINFRCSYCENVVDTPPDFMEDMTFLCGSCMSKIEIDNVTFIDKRKTSPPLSELEWF